MKLRIVLLLFVNFLRWLRGRKARIPSPRTRPLIPPRICPDLLYGQPHGSREGQSSHHRPGTYGHRSPQPIS
jgi:hypothetical protein